MIKHFCPKCNEEITTTKVRKKIRDKEVVKLKPLFYPIFDSNKKLIWKNLFHIDFISLILMLSIIFMTVGYKIDMAKCETAISEPCKFCNTTGCCEYNSYVVQQPTFIFEEVNNESSIPAIFDKGD